MTKIPFVNLSKQFLSLQDELVEAFIDVGTSGTYIMGDKLTEFEKLAAAYFDVPYAIGVANGSDALLLVLKALNVGPGDEVITATNSFIATAWVIAATGATPVLVDVSEDLNIDPEKIAKAISPNTKAIIPVHLTGKPARMDEINRIARENNLFVIEDAAQAIGAVYCGKKVGSLGDAAGFSLHPLKNLGVYGDGGFITTKDKNIYERIMLLRNHGLKNRDECEEWGINSRLDSIQASFALIKLKKLDRWNIRCREIASIYTKELSGVVETPLDSPESYSVYHNYVIRTPHRDFLQKKLSEQGVETKIHYPIPIHLQSAAKYLGYKLGDFPAAEEYASTMLSLPIYPELGNDEVMHITNVLKASFKEDS